MSDSILNLQSAAQWKSMTKKKTSDMQFTLNRLSMIRMEMQLIYNVKAGVENILVSAYFIGKDGN